MTRIRPLDGIRGVAILLVVLWHYLSRQIIAEPRSLLYYFHRGLGLTWSGVDLFFVLSGFLIAGILLDNRGASNYFQVFYLRRICRIFPLYFLLLLLFIIFGSTSVLPQPTFDWLFAHPVPLWSYATFTQNIFMGIRGDFGPQWLGITWSLAVEEQFYLLMPLIIYSFQRRTVFIILLFSIISAGILHFASPGFHAFVNTPWRADSLLSGACLAILIRSQDFSAALIRNKRYLYVLFVILLVGGAILTLRPAPLGGLQHLWLAELYSMLILLAVVDTDGYVSRILSNKVLVWFGMLSYGIYMFHQAVSGLVHGILRGGSPSIQSATDAGVTGVAFLITLILAAVSYAVFEKPLLQLGHRLSYLERTKDDKIPSLGEMFGNQKQA